MARADGTRSVSRHQPSQVSAACRETELGRVRKRSTDAPSDDGDPPAVSEDEVEPAPIVGTPRIVGAPHSAPPKPQQHRHPPVRGPPTH
jgi:hypothetical protein